MKCSVFLFGIQLVRNYHVKFLLLTLLLQLSLLVHPQNLPMILWRWPLNGAVILSEPFQIRLEFAGLIDDHYYLLKIYVNSKFASQSTFDYDSLEGMTTIASTPGYPEGPLLIEAELWDTVGPQSDPLDASFVELRVRNSWPAPAAAPRHSSVQCMGGVQQALEVFPSPRRVCMFTDVCWARGHLVYFSDPEVRRPRPKSTRVRWTATTAMRAPRCGARCYCIFYLLLLLLLVLLLLLLLLFLLLLLLYYHHHHHHHHYCVRCQFGAHASTPSARPTARPPPVRGPLAPPAPLLRGCARASAQLRARARWRRRGCVTARARALGRRVRVERQVAPLGDDDDGGGDDE